MIDVRRLLHSLGLDGDAMRPTFLGCGTDNRAFGVGDRWILRQRLEITAVTARETDREHRLLDVLTDRLPVPVPRVVGADPDNGILVVERLPGRSALDMPPEAPSTLLPQLLDLLAALASIRRDAVHDLVDEDDTPMTEYRHHIDDLVPLAAAALRPAQGRLLESFLQRPPPPEAGRRVLTHNDLGAEHLLLSEDRTRITGVIDWTDAAWSDPAHDLGRIGRDLGFPLADRLAAHLFPDDGALPERIRFHARISLIEDLAYGLEHGDRRYSDAALASFARTFGPEDVRAPA